VSIKSRLFGDIAMVGLEFDQLDERLSALIEGELARVSQKAR
jgi:hypothetical protein